MKSINTGNIVITDSLTAETIEFTSNNIQLDINPSSRQNEKLSYNFTSSINADVSSFNSDFFSDLLENKSKATITTKFVAGFTTVQKRKHHKKRINKKYAKLYGYVEKPVYKKAEAEVFEIKTEDINGDASMSFEFK